MSELGVPVPASISLMRRFVKNATVEQRENALRKGSYNLFAFPADLLILDFLSDSGTSCMTDLQWASLVLGDESYGRNKATSLFRINISMSLKGMFCTPMDGRKNSPQDPTTSPTINAGDSSSMLEP